MQPPDSISVFVGTDGTVRFVYDDDVAAALGDVGPSTTVRASHVEPSPHAWHDGAWFIDLCPSVQASPIGPFPRRDQALAAEKLIVEKILAGESIVECFSPAWLAAFLEGAT